MPPKSQYPKDETGINYRLRVYILAVIFVSYIFISCYVYIINSIIFIIKFFCCAGQYITLHILKSFKHGEKVTIKKVYCGNIEYLIPSDVIQVGPSSNVENYEAKFYFTAHTQVSVLYQREDGSTKTQALRHLKEVRYS